MTITKCDGCGKEIELVIEVTKPSTFGVNSGVHGFKFLVPNYEMGAASLKFVSVEICFECATHWKVIRK